MLRFILCLFFIYPSLAVALTCTDYLKQEPFKADIEIVRATIARAQTASSFVSAGEVKALKQFLTKLSTEDLELLGRRFLSLDITNIQFANEYFAGQSLLILPANYGDSTAIIDGRFLEALKAEEQIEQILKLPQVSIDPTLLPLGFKASDLASKIKLFSLKIKNSLGRANISKLNFGTASYLIPHESLKNTSILGISLHPRSPSLVSLLFSKLKKPPAEPLEHQLDLDSILLQVFRAKEAFN